MEIDYKNLEKIRVINQEQLNNIPLDFKGQIIINGGTINNEIVIENKYYLEPIIINRSCVIVLNNSCIKAYENSKITVGQKSSVEAYDNSHVKAYDNSTVESYEDSHVIAWDNSQIEAHNKSRIEAFENSFVIANENTQVKANDDSHIEAYDNSLIKAYGSSCVKACGNSSIIAYHNNYIEAYNNNYIEAHGNSQILDMQKGAEIKISGNARIIYMPKNINEFMNFHEIKYTKTKAIFYKAVHKDENGIYKADYDENFIYEIGKTKEEKCDKNINNDCSYGINIATLDYALDYGENWKNLAILEVETKISDIIMPKDTDGKVRTSKVKVLREISLKEYE